MFLHYVSGDFLVIALPNQHPDSFPPLPPTFFCLFPSFLAFFLSFILPVADMWTCDCLWVSVVGIICSHSSDEHVQHDQH